MAMKWFKNRYVLLTILPLILSCSDSFDRAIEVSEESSESGSIVLGLANLYFTEEMANLSSHWMVRTRRRLKNLWDSANLCKV